MTVQAVPIRRPESQTEETRVTTRTQETKKAAFGQTVIEALGQAGAATPSQLGRVTGVPELIVRSVLEALTFARAVEFDRETDEYSVLSEALKAYAVLDSIK